MAAPESEVPPEEDLRVLAVGGAQVSLEESVVLLSGTAQSSVACDPLAHRPVVNQRLDNAWAGIALAKEACHYVREQAGLPPADLQGNPQEISISTQVQEILDDASGPPEVTLGGKSAHGSVSTTGSGQGGASSSGGAASTVGDSITELVCQDLPFHIILPCLASITSSPLLCFAAIAGPVCCVMEPS